MRLGGRLNFCGIFRDRGMQTRPIMTGPSWFNFVAVGMTAGKADEMGSQSSGGIGLSMFLVWEALITTPAVWLLTLVW
jgi:hypothetical protein